MNLTKKTIFTLIVATILLGCDSRHNAEAKPFSVSVDMNTLPVIIRSVSEVIPELNQSNRDTVFNLVCRVAYGEVKPAILREEINKQGIIKENSLTQLVQSDDIKSYQTVCAAHIIQSAGTIPDVNKYVTEQKNADGQMVIKADEAAVINYNP